MPDPVVSGGYGFGGAHLAIARTHGDAPIHGANPECPPPFGFIVSRPDRIGALRNFPLDIARLFVTTFLVMTNAVTYFRAVADETRWRIVRLVTDRALCVCELADILGMPQSSVSSHVQILRKAGLFEEETCGKWTYFRIGRGHLPLLKAILRQFPDDPTHTVDAERATARLARRETSCCQGPVKLAKPRKVSSQ